MSFLTRHSPRHITDLVFRDPNVGAIITDYAHGLRDKHLLLHGPAGSGKSVAAQIILHTRVAELYGSAVACPFNPRNYNFDNFDPLLRDWSAQLQNGVTRGYTVIDEVDFFSTQMQQRLRAFIDSTELGTIIATTNNLHKLDDPFKDRFRKLVVERPKAVNWTARAQAILAAEGVVLTQEQVATLLRGFDGSARELIEWLEDCTLTFKRNPAQIVLPSQIGVAANSGIIPPRGKTLINGRSLTGTKGAQT